MRLRFVATLTGLFVLGALLLGAVSAPVVSADAPEDEPRLRDLVPPFDHDPGFWLRESIIDAAAETIGVRPIEVRYGLLHGASLKEIAARNGVLAPELKRGIIQYEAHHLYRLVDAGVLSPLEAARILWFVTDNIERIINYHPAP